MHKPKDIRIPAFLQIRPSKTTILKRKFQTATELQKREIRPVCIRSYRYTRARLSRRLPCEKGRNNSLREKPQGNSE